MKKFDSIVDRAVSEALIEDLKRREREAIENLEFILRQFAAEEEEDNDEYGEDEYGEFDEDADDDWFYEEESEEMNR